MAFCLPFLPPRLFSPRPIYIYCRTYSRWLLHLFPTAAAAIFTDCGYQWKMEKTDDYPLKCDRKQCLDLELAIIDRLYQPYAGCQRETHPEDIPVEDQVGTE